MMTQYEQDMQDEIGSEIGDARVCPFHRWIKTSSADGLHDGVCDECEGEASEYSAYMDWREWLEASGVVCHDAGLVEGKVCPKNSAQCLTLQEYEEESSEIPF